MTAPSRPVVLLIFDGWGLREPDAGNAIALANPRCYERLLSEYPWTRLEASGEAVGLPEGQMGNSEVGHLNMGAGRVVYQELTRINKSIKDGDFFQNPVLIEAMRHVQSTGGTLHLMGLHSPGGVHSSLDHLDALIRMARDENVEKLRVHAFLDGRDVPPRSAEAGLKAIEATLLEEGYPQIATVIGRYYAMDRDQRWERTEKAYDNLVMATGTRAAMSLNALELSYKQDLGDEFVLPYVTDLTYEGMADGDAILFYNFRPDRARQLSAAFTQKDFAGFERPKVLDNLYFGCMCVYDERFGLPVAYPKQSLRPILAEVVSDQGIKQFHTAETEKYAHVTFFFNGGIEAPFPGEERKLIPSPKVATYDLQPEMSVSAVADAVVEAVSSREFGLVICNFANPDMVGHTGVLPAAVEAVKSVDEALNRLVDAVLAADGVLLLTADHGNIECMVDTDGGPHTAHTTDPVPLVLVSNHPNDLKLKLANGQVFALSSIAPTILDLLGVAIPSQMTSPSLLVRASAAVKA